MKFFERFDQLSPRLVFSLVALALVLPVLKPLGMPVYIDQQMTQPVYNWIERLSPGDIVMFDISYGGGSDAELSPQLRAWFYHCLKKGLKPVGVAQWETGANLAAPLLEATAKLAKDKGYAAEYGTDWVFVGWKNMVWREMINDFWKATGRTDFYGKDFEELPLMKKLTKWDTNQTKGLIIFSAGSPGIPTYTTYWPEHEIYVGDVAVQVAGTSNYLRAGQVKGILAGLRGAAEYEKLAGLPGLGTKLMDAQSLGHLLILALVVLGNISYFIKLSKRRKPTT